ncbi:hypothetical protein CsSME_00021557 [Camellia sinensis var. sinensis]
MNDIIIHRYIYIYIYRERERERERQEEAVIESVGSTRRQENREAKQEGRPECLHVGEWREPKTKTWRTRTSCNFRRIWQHYCRCDRQSQMRSRSSGAGDSASKSHFEYLHK